MENNMNNIAPGLSSSAVIDSKNVVCPDCGSTIFREVCVLKKVSPLVAGGHTDVIVPIPLYVCDHCGCPADGLTDAATLERIIGKKESSSII